MYRKLIWLFCYDNDSAFLKITKKTPKTYAFAWIWMVKSAYNFSLELHQWKNVVPIQ